VGVYRVAGIFAEMMQRLPNVAGAVLLPKVIQGQEGEADLSLRVARNILLFSLLCALGLAVAGKFLIALIFPKYPAAYAPLLWMLPGLVIAGFGSVFNTRLAGQGYPAITLWAPALALALNVALNLTLIPVLGLKGAALSTSLAYALWGLLTAHRCLGQLGCGWIAFLRGTPSPPSIKKP
jgi:O-antigen/teichoic acid export membrane protein